MAIPTLQSTQAYVLNLDDSSAAIYTLSEDTVGNKASLIKLLTVFTMMEHGFNTKTLMEAEVATVIAADIVGGTGTPFVVGEDYDMWACAMLALFESSNDACQLMARHIGTEIFIAAGSTGSTGVARFVEEMDTVATNAGATNTTITIPDGRTGNTTTVEDLGLILRAANTSMFDNADMRAVFRQYQTTVDYDNGSPQTRTTQKEGMNGQVPPGHVMGKAGTTGHKWWVCELPNGQHVGIVTSGGDSGDDDFEDAMDLYRQILIDFPSTLGTPGTPATLSWMATQAGGNLLAWDDTSLMYQDDGTSTPADADTDPVRRWYPSDEIGTSGHYFRCDSEAARPQRDTTTELGLITFGNGASATLHLGAKGFEDTTFFADANEEYMVAMYCLGSGSSGHVFGRRGSGSIDLQFAAGSATTNIRNVRGNTGSLHANVPAPWTSDEESVCGAFWDATDFRWMGGGQTGEAGTAGTASDSANNFFLGRHGGGFDWDGELGRIIMLDKADLDIFQHMRDWALDSPRNQFRDATGAAPGGGAALPSHMNRATQVLLTR